MSPTTKKEAGNYRDMHAEKNMLTQYRHAQAVLYARGGCQISQRDWPETLGHQLEC